MPPRKPVPAPDKPYSDFIQPFLIDRSAIRGRLVRLETSLSNILAAHNYPLALSQHLAELGVLAALLSATLSGDGILTVQVKGDGAVRFMVVDVMAGGVIRGYAAADEDALAKVMDNSSSAGLSQVIGKGYLAVTLDPGGAKERYQGIVELSGDSLSDAFSGYFLQSQQAEVMLHVAVQPPDKKHKNWRAGGIIIERIPVEGGKELEFNREEQDELWKRTGLFMRTLKDTEMLDPSVTPQNLLYRLFNEDGVWVYKLQPLVNGCRCSRKRVSTVLKSLPKQELVDSLTDCKLTIHCEFCNKKEVYSSADVDKLFSKPTARPKRK
jgi:molecular chaperone Hsp33